MQPRCMHSPKSFRSGAHVLGTYKIAAMQSLSQLDILKSGSDKAVGSRAEERGKNKQTVMQWAKDMSLELQITTSFFRDLRVAAFVCFGPSEGPDCQMDFGEDEHLPWKEAL